MSNDVDVSSMLRVGTVLHGVYRIDRYLSSGGFGNTYVATHVELGKRVAIKEFFMSGVAERDANTTTVSVSNTHNRETFASQLAKFKKEARRLCTLSSPHIVRVSDLFEENGTAYYVMDYIDGENLSDYLRRTGGPMPEAEVMRILPQILDALDAAHSAGIWHLDLKPANIMLNRQGNALLIDFGASKQQSRAGGATTSTAVSYTNGYAPLEQMEQNLNKFGPWTDFYALGATLYTLLTSKKPPLPSDIDDDETSDKHDTLPMPKSISRETCNLVLWMMNTNRRLRPQSVAEIRSRMANSSESIVVADKTIIVPQKVSAEFGNYSTEILADETETIMIEKKGFWRKRRIIPLSFVMKGVQGGVFTMGATSEQGSDALDSEKPVHRVAVSSFRIGQTEVTQALWKAVMGTNPSYFKGDNKPVECVSWEDCQEFIRKLNSLTGKAFRLPTEAEWEYAARGGNKSQGYKYSGSNNLDKVGWYADNSGKTTHEVATKSPNELGLYDMSGNVEEWCFDRYDDYSSNSQTDPTGTSWGSARVYRGGSSSFDRYCRVSYRCYDAPDFCSFEFGFRLAS